MARHRCLVSVTCIRRCRRCVHIILGSNMYSKNNRPFVSCLNPQHLRQECYTLLRKQLQWRPVCRCSKKRKPPGFIMASLQRYDTIYSVSQKNPPEDLWRFFQNGWEFFNQILRAYYAFLFTLDYKFVFNNCNFDEVMPY